MIDNEVFISYIDVNKSERKRPAFLFKTHKKTGLYKSSKL